MAGLVSPRTFSALATHWNATRTATPWRTSRQGNPTRRIAGGISVTVERDKRTGDWKVRFNGGRGGVSGERFATEVAARRAVDAIEARR